LNGSISKLEVFLQTPLVHMRDAKSAFSANQGEGAHEERIFSIIRFLDSRLIGGSIGWTALSISGLSNRGTFSVGQTGTKSPDCEKSSTQTSSQRYQSGTV